MLKQLLDKYLKDYHDEVLQDEDCNADYRNAFAVLRYIGEVGLGNDISQLDGWDAHLVDSIRSNYGCNEGYRVGYNEQWVEGYLNG